MVKDGPGDDGLSQLLRRQLHDLRIDPDLSIESRRRPRRGLKAFLSGHTEAVLLVGGTAAALVIVVWIALVISSASSSQSAYGSSFGAPSVAVSFGADTVLVSQPAYRRLSPGQGMLMLRVKLRNPSNTREEVRAGDLLLADSRGALFPTTWRQADGNWLDGLTDPRHRFLALDPGADTAVDLHFLVMSEGPFTLRYEPSSDLAEASVPELTLTGGS